MEHFLAQREKRAQVPSWWSECLPSSGCSSLCCEALGPSPREVTWEGAQGEPQVPGDLVGVQGFPRAGDPAGLFLSGGVWANRLFPET